MNSPLPKAAQIGPPPPKPTVPPPEPPANDQLGTIPGVHEHRGNIVKDRPYQFNMRITDSKMHEIRLQAVDERMTPRDLMLMLFDEYTKRKKRRK